MCDLTKLHLKTEISEKKKQVVTNFWKRKSGQTAKPIKISRGHWLKTAASFIQVKHFKNIIL